MKTNKKVFALLTMVFLGSVGLYQLTQAEEVNPESKPLMSNGVRGEIKNMTTEERQEFLKENKERRQEKRKVHFQEITTRINDKLDTVLIKLEEAGIDTSNLEVYINELRKQQDDLQVIVEKLDTAIDSGDQEAIQTTRDKLRTATQITKDYYYNTLRPAIKEAIEKALAERTNQ